VVAPGYTIKEARAALGEDNHFLCVREVIDLVAFLRQGTKATGK